MNKENKKINTFNNLKYSSLVIVVTFLILNSLFLIPIRAEAGMIMQVPNYLGLSNGLVGHWTFDGIDMAGTDPVTAYDRSGQGNNATGTSTTLPTRASGKIGQGLNFDGTDDRIMVDHSTSQNLTGGFTLSIWTNLRTLGPSDLARIIDKQTATNGEGGFTLRVSTTAGIVVNVNAGGNVGTAAGTLPLNSWTHIVTTVAVGGGATHYINGVALATGTTGDPASSFTTTNPLALGNRSISTNRPVDGVIDDVRIYNRVLSTDEINRLYNIGATFKVNTTRKDTLTNGLVGHWSFDGTDVAGTDPLTAFDRSGQGNNATGTSTTLPTRASGKIGQGLSFDGVDDYLDAGVNISFDVNTKFSLSLWIRGPSSQDGGAGLICKGNGNGGEQFCLDVATNFRFFVRNSAASATILTTSVGPSNSWQLVTATFDISAGIMKLYVNGVEIGTRIPSDSILTTDHIVSVGSRQSGSGAYNLNFNGIIDDVRIYNHALSADEIKRLYNIGATFKVNTTRTNVLTDGLVGHWSFDGTDVAGTDPLTAYDRSGQDNNGTSTGTTLPVRVPGKIGQGLNFDGSNDYISIGDVSTLNFEYTNSFSGCAWINPNNVTGLSYDIMSKMDNGNPWKGWSFDQFRRSSLKATAISVFLVNNATTNLIEVGSPANSIVANQWQHACFTYNGSGQAAGVRLYIDGVSQTLTVVEDTLAGNSIQTNEIAGIGIRGGTAQAYAGKIDDVRIYNRTLSPDEIKQLYNMGR